MIFARDMGRVRPSKDKKDATSYPPSEEMKKLRKVNKDPSALDKVKEKYKGQIMNVKEDMGELEHADKVSAQIRGFDSKDQKHQQRQEI